MDKKHLQATTHCNCNKHGAGRWMYYGDVKNNFWHQSCLFPCHNCITCGYYLWYDAYFDNMMFDLKGMNQ